LRTSSIAAAELPQARGPACSLKPSPCIHTAYGAAAYFNDQIDALTKSQLTDYFVRILDTHSWSTLKHDLYGLKFYYAHVLGQLGQKV
jgi:hypothetical protein